MEAIASAFPTLWPYRVDLALLMLVVIALLNLRGLQETGTAMAVPVYLFLFTFLPTLAWGALRLIREGMGSLASIAPPATEPLTAFLTLHTFASGCTALTGIEAISNGAPCFRPPEARNAGRTLIAMAVLMAVLFAGSVSLTQAFAVIPRPDETILSALARRVLGAARPTSWFRSAQCSSWQLPPTPVSPDSRAWRPSWPPMASFPAN